MIAPHDRLASVLARDERLVEVLAGLSDQLRMLRSPAVREVMEKLVTVEEAARMAGMSPPDLVARLEAALQGGSRDLGCGSETPDGVRAPRPDKLDATAPELIDDLDVRDDLRRGAEPFHRIMAAVTNLPEDHVLRLRATFDPGPLRSVMAQRGFAAHAEQLGEKDWLVWFYRDAAAQSASASASPAAPPPPASNEDAPEIIVLDVRGLEPPEPMSLTLSALSRLPPGGRLVQVNVRVPELLLPMLTQRGFTYEIHELEPELVKVVIQHSTRKDE